MKTYPLYKDRILFAFEINNTFVRNKKIALILKKVNNVTNIQPRKTFTNDEGDIHLKFKYLNQKYIVWEAYGDSSRYWIGPEEENDILDISAIEKAFSFSRWFHFL